MLTTDHSKNMDRGAIQRRVYVVLSTLVAVLLLGAFNAWYTHHIAHASEQSLCALLIVQDNAYREHPPITDTGRQIAEEVRKLRDRYQC